ncbi:hypothetical protein LTR12_011291 [Friedmanniomyces endolithicus]|nr:hypothetical protein LTR12_011291 [Friedmanniomyces endolithicus]
MSVDAVTSQMAQTSIHEPTSTAEGASVGTGGSKPINASQNEAVIASAAEGRRLYIGNLAYATTEGELKDFFKDYLVYVLARYAESYAFVDVSTPSEAERAINELNGKNILDRKVSVQLARKPEPAGAAAEGGAAEGEEGQQRRRSSTRGRGRGRSGRTRGGRGARGGRKEGEQNGEVAEGGEATAKDGPTNVPGQAAPLTSTTNEAESAAPNADDKAANARQPRKQRGPPEDGVPSKTKIMVANLPYDLREEKLLELFADYSPTQAKIALRPIPKFMIRKLQARNEPRKGRGFGFVTLTSEELQQKACEEMNGKEIEGREIAVKVAIDSPGKEDEDPSAAAGMEGGAEVEGKHAGGEGVESATAA